MPSHNSMATTGRAVNSKSARTGLLDRQVEALEVVVVSEAAACVEVLVVEVGAEALEVAMVDVVATEGVMEGLLEAASMTRLPPSPVVHHRTLSPTLLPLEGSPASLSTCVMYAARNLPPRHTRCYLRNLATVVYQQRGPSGAVHDHRNCGPRRDTI